MIELAVFSYISGVVLWVFYLAAMKLKAHKKELTGTAKFFGYQVIFVGLVIDVAFNIVVGSILFMALPVGGLTFTSRLIHYKNSGGYRGKVQKWFCGNLLDMFDPSGPHCK